LLDQWRTRTLNGNSTAIRKGQQHDCGENFAEIRSKFNTSTWFAAGTMKTSWRILQGFLHHGIPTTDDVVGSSRHQRDVVSDQQSNAKSTLGIIHASLEIKETYERGTNNKIRAEN